MARYYDVDKILEKIREFYRVNPSGDTFMHLFCAFNDNNCKRIIEEVIKELPTADVVEVVRCKKCKSFVERENAPDFCSKRRKWTNENDFCSSGKRKEDNDKVR